MKTEIICVHPDFPETDRIARCARIIRQGGLVIFPTETVYGIAADAKNPRAVERLRQVKRRREGKPFSIMFASKEDALRYMSSGQRPGVFRLIDCYWPGPLTVVVPSLRPGETDGIRVPDHAAARALLKECGGGPVAAPSANIEGHPPPATCQEALRDFDGLIDAAIDAGPAQAGLSSAIVDCTHNHPVMLREGAVSREDVARVMNMKTILVVCTGNSCRSVMGEYLLRNKLNGRPDIAVMSAGTNVFITSPASSGAQQILSRRGIDASGHLSQPVTGIVLRKADLILVMTRRHREALLQFAPDIEKRVYLLREFLPTGMGAPEELDIPDPIGQTDSAYEECARIIDMAMDQVVKLL